MTEGWIKLHRCIQEHWIWQDSQKLKWWLDLLLLANHKGNKFLIGNEVMELERGEHHTSEIKLMERWKTSKTSVRRFLSLLESDGMIELKKTKKGTTIKVLNYGVYQDFSEEEKPQKNHKKTIEEPQKNHMVYTNNNDKNEKNDKNNIGRFTPPSYEEVEAYCMERNNGIDAQNFIDFYQARGWMIGKNKMKDWKASVRTWEQRRKEIAPAPKRKIVR